MKLDMSDLILEDSEQIEVIKELEGYQDGPNWVPGTKQSYLVQASVFYLSAEDLKQYEAGKYTTQDIALEVVEGYEVVNKDTGQVEDVEISHDVVLYDGKEFKVDEISDFTAHSDYYELICKKVIE